MTAEQQASSVDQPEPGGGQVRFTVKPGSKVQVTVDVGEKDADGRVPITVNAEEVLEGKLQAEENAPGAADRPGFSIEALAHRLKAVDLAAWLFLSAVGIYLVTRLIGLTHFPIYFFTDEAIQTQSIVDLVNNNYQSATHIWLPTYFRNGEYYNLSLSVYLQWLPYMLFGKSAVVTRATSVLVTLIAAISVGIILRDIFKLKYWWTGTLFLSITPAWFLHSRTAFETAEFVSFYAGTLCAYLLYRYRSPRYLYLALFMAACAFYTYSPAQLVVPLTVITLLISDWRYHRENYRRVLIGLGFGASLALPYLRFILNNPNTPFAHLHTLGSYWLTNEPFVRKLAHYLSEYLIGLSPWYWYIPNIRDLSRHLMKGYGDIMIFTLPFAVIGLASALRNLRQPAYRAVIIFMLMSPAAAALVQTGITRTLAFVIPASILTAIGFEKILGWIKNPGGRLTELSLGPGPDHRRIGWSLLIMAVGIGLASLVQQTADRIVLLALAALLWLQVSGLDQRLAQRLMETRAVKSIRRWNLKQTFLALSVFATLAAINVGMLNDALTNGPLWFDNYGMGGMQYGAFQVFDIIKEYVHEHPETKIIFSPDWANGTDVVARFFLGDPLPVEMGSIRGHMDEELPLDESMLFIITPQEYRDALESPKFTDVRVQKIIPYPDGNPGFYFVHLRYVDNIDELFAAEKAARQALQESFVTIDDEQVRLRYSHLDSDTPDQSIALVFDHDPYTLAKTLESNPFVIEMTFPSVHKINGFSIIIGSAKAELTLKFYSAPDAQPVIYSFSGQGSLQHPELSFDLPHPTEAKILQLEMHDPLSPETAQIHIWELKLR